MFFQQVNNRGLINPATTGKGGDINAAYTIRQQWIGFPGPTTQAIYGHGFVRQVRSGFGLSWINDKFRPQRTNNIKINYAYFIPFEEVAFLSFGLGMGVMSNIYDESDLFGQDLSDELITGGKQSKTLPDFDFGFEFNTRQWEIGASVTHITYMYDDQSLVRPMRNIYAYTRVKLPMNKYWDFIPGITWHNTRTLSTCELNAAFRYNNNICVNLVYRNPMDCGIAFGIDVYGGIRLTYSYDYGIDNMSSYNSGSHEITLSYNIPVNTTYVRSRLRFFRWKMF
jgi:type IX secretion system PorP/SprF family membrane protein